MGKMIHSLLGKGLRWVEIGLLGIWSGFVNFVHGHKVHQSAHKMLISGLCEFV